MMLLLFGCWWWWWWCCENDINDSYDDDVSDSPTYVTMCKYIN